MYLNLNPAQFTEPVLVGTVPFGQADSFQDSNYGVPNSPQTPPSQSVWTRQSSGGSFINGNKVSYAVSFVNEVGESKLGPWSEWQVIDGANSGPQLTNIPTDPIQYMASPTIARNIYRRFVILVNQLEVATVPIMIGTLNDNTGSVFTDLNWGAPMPPTTAPNAVNVPYAQSTPSGGWVTGNEVFYAATFVNAFGESELGPWCDAVTINQYALPLLSNVPIDNSNVDPESATTSRKIYRCFSVQGNDPVLYTPTLYNCIINDNVTTQVQDNDYGAPNPPSWAPQFLNTWWNSTQGGSFVNGNQVSYAASFVAQNGEESEVGPWCNWIQIGSEAAPQFNIGSDPNQSNYLHNPTVSICLYRKFIISIEGNSVITAMQKVQTLPIYTTQFTDTDFGPSMPPITHPSGPGYGGSWTAATPAGGFVAGNLVAYAASYVNSAGYESIVGPWSQVSYIENGLSALPQITDLPTSGTIFQPQFGGPTAINIYRMIYIGSAGDQLNRTLNTKAISKEETDASEKEGTLTIKKVKCDYPSTGVSTAFEKFVEANEVAASIYVTAGGVMCMVPPTAPFGAIVVGLSGIWLLAAIGTQKIVPEIGSSFDDQVYLNINNNKVWPTNQNYVKFGDNSEVDVNYTMNFSGDNVVLQLMEYDLSEDDVLLQTNIGMGSLGVGQGTPDITIQIVNENENCCYTIIYSLLRTA